MHHGCAYKVEQRVKDGEIPVNLQQDDEIKHRSDHSQQPQMNAQAVRPQQPQMNAQVQADRPRAVPSEDLYQQQEECTTSPKKCRELENIITDLKEFMKFDDAGIHPSDEVDIVGAMSSLLRTVKEVDKLCSYGLERLAWSDLQLIRDIIFVMETQGWQKIWDDESEVGIGNEDISLPVTRLAEIFRVPLDAAGNPSLAGWFLGHPRHQHYKIWGFLSSMGLRVVHRPPLPPALEDLGVPQQHGSEATVSLSTGSAPSAEPSPQPFSNLYNKQATSTILIFRISTPAPTHVTTTQTMATTTTLFIYRLASLGPSTTGQSDSTSCSATKPPAEVILALQNE
eukprot:Em0001g1056a